MTQTRTQPKDTTSVSENSLRFGKCVQSIKTLTVNSHHYIHQNVTCKILLDWSWDVFSEYQIFIIFSHTKLDILVVKCCIGIRANSNSKDLFETEVVYICQFGASRPDTC